MLTSIRPHWRSTFFVQAGVGGVIFLLGLLFIEKDKTIGNRKQDNRVEWFGAFLVTGGLAILFFVLGDRTVAPRGWKTGRKHFVSLLPVF